MKLKKSFFHEGCKTIKFKGYFNFVTFRSDRLMISQKRCNQHHIIDQRFAKANKPAIAIIIRENTLNFLVCLLKVNAFKTIANTLKPKPTKLVVYCPFKISGKRQFDPSLSFRCNLIFLHRIYLGIFCILYSFSIISKPGMPAKF